MRIFSGREIPDKSPVAQTYRLIKRAAEEIGANTYAHQRQQHIKAGRSPKTFRFCPTAEHLEICEMMPKVLSGEVEWRDAFHLIYEYEVMQQRLGNFS